MCMGQSLRQRQRGVACSASEIEDVNLACKEGAELTVST